MTPKPMYSRSNAPKARVETQMPDMDKSMSSAPEGKASGEKKESKKLVSSEPVVGFLYSVSRTPAGEYWPLHLGENTIGRVEDNDIVLPEMTVSEHHATLNIRRMKTTKEYVADIYVRGVNGGFVNDHEVRKDAECKNGDFLTIGDNYILYLILVNPFELGLKVADDFVPTEESESKSDFDPRFEMDKIDMDRTYEGSMYDSSRRRRQGGTEGMDDNLSDFQEGFTSHLP